MIVWNSLDAKTCCVLTFRFLRSNSENYLDFCDQMNAKKNMEKKYTEVLKRQVDQIEGGV